MNQSLSESHVCNLATNNNNTDSKYEVNDQQEEINIYVQPNNLVHYVSLANTDEALNLDNETNNSSLLNATVTAHQLSSAALSNVNNDDLNLDTATYLMLVEDIHQSDDNYDRLNLVDQSKNDDCVILYTDANAIETPYEKYLEIIPHDDTTS